MTAAVARRTRTRTAGLTIKLSRGTGSGPTRLAAFDAALQEAGVADLNLLRLSSVIPPHSEVIIVPGAEQVPGAHGDLLYCVYAEAYASTPGEAAWAGLAWSVRPEDGAGLLVEHHGASEETVLEDLHASIEDLGRRRGGAFRTAGTATAHAVCERQPVCALVVAAYRSAGWD